VDISSAKQQVSLLRYVGTLLPPKTPVFLVGDSEFGSMAVLRQLDQCIGSMFYAKKATPACGSTSRPIGKHWIVSFKRRSECLVSKCVSDPVGDLSNLRFGVLADG